MKYPVLTGLSALLVAITGIAGPSRAAAPQPEDNIIVTATRSTIPLEHAIVPVTVITRQDIEQSLAADLAELLRFEAGIDIARNGGPGQSTAIFIRGTESNHTLVLIDGVRINPGTVGGAAVQHLAPETIERVEIVKGARSALFGTDAIGGVINVITRRSDRSSVQAAVGGGSFDTRSAFLAAGRNREDSDIAVSVNWQDTDGFPARTGIDTDRGYDNLTATLHAGMRLGRNDLALRHWQAAGRNEYFDFFLAPLDQDFRVASSALELRTTVNDGLESKLVLSHISDDIRQNQSADFVKSKRNTLDWQLSLADGNHRWIGGLYLVDENAASRSFGSGFDQDTIVKAVFIEDQWSSGPQRAFLAARLTDHETFGNHVTWNAEYAFAVNDHWTISAGAGHAFRAPDATDRYGFGGDPGLEPEVADELQAGLRVRASERHSFGLEIYRKVIDDLIEFDLAIFELRNIAEAEIRGAELEWEYRGEGYSLRSSLVRQSAENVKDGARLLRRAETSMTINLLKDIGEHRVGLSMLASGDRADFGGVELPGYVLVNLTGRLAVGHRWRLNARIENVLDTNYETAAGFRMQERSYFVDLGFGW